MNLFLLSISDKLKEIHFLFLIYSKNIIQKIKAPVICLFTGALVILLSYNIKIHDYKFYKIKNLVIKGVKSETVAVIRRATGKPFVES